MSSADDRIGDRQTISRMGMTDDQFREAAKELVDYVIGHYNSMKGKQPCADVKPGFMRQLIPDTAPQGCESWSDVFKDLDRVVMEGATHWQSSRFFGFYPTALSYPAILADILSDACASIGFTWASNPPCTELETIMMDWLAKAIGLPDCFLHEGKGPGAGVIQGTASEATIMTLLAARTKIIKKKMSENQSLTKHDVLSRLVAYTSEYSHCSVERASLIGMVDMRQLQVDGNISLRGETLRRAMEEDKAAGKIPFYVCATLGTTPCCSFDNLFEIGEICENEEDVWLHVDAAYAGSSFICPEYRKFLKGIELSDSFNFNPHKWLSVNFDCSALWVKDSLDLTNSLHVDPLYLRHDEQGAGIDYRHWQIPLGRRFRSLKLWFVLRMFGVEGLREKIRTDVRHAKSFESHVRSDPRFEVVFPVELGLVCWRLVQQKDNSKENREINERLLKRINDSRDVFLIASEVAGIYFLRVSTGAIACDSDAIDNCWAVIERHATSLLGEMKIGN